MMNAAADIVIRPIRREDHDAWQPPEARFGGLIYFPYTQARAALDAALAARPDLRRRIIVDVDPVSVL